MPEPDHTVPQAVDELLAAIALKYLRVSSLTSTGSDRIDYHHCSVWNIRTALDAAFKAGVEIGARMTAK